MIAIDPDPVELRMKSTVSEPAVGSPRIVLLENVTLFARTAWTLPAMIRLFENTVSLPAPASDSVTETAWFVCSMTLPVIVMVTGPGEVGS